LDPAYIDIMQREAKICRYLDMPLQHVSERVLKTMKRGGNRRVLEDLLNRVRLKVPDIALRTTMIVGFPGETDKDFEELMKFCLETQFDHLGVFSYFDEEGTASSTLKPKIPEALKEERKELLMTQQARISFAKNRQRVGKTMRVLVEGISQESEHILQGRTAWQAPEIDGCVLLTDSRIVELQAGKFYNVKITRALEHDLIGRVISSSFS
jgi:ribosomal protein S12 methylthiotransferase